MTARQAAARALEQRALSDGPILAGLAELEEFGGLDQALAYLHGRWVTYVGAAADAEAERGSEDPVEVVRQAWRRVMSDHPGLLDILVRHSDAPVLAEADARHRQRVASGAGCRPDELPSFQDIAALLAELTAVLADDDAPDGPAVATREAVPAGA